MQLPRAAPASQVGARRSGIELSANIHGAEPVPRPRHASSHVNATQKITLDLSANDYGVEACNLGVNCYGAELRFQKMKRNLQRSKCEYLLKKGLKKIRNLLRLVSCPRYF